MLPLRGLLSDGLLGLGVHLALTHEILGLRALATDHHEQAQIHIGLCIFRIELCRLHQWKARRIEVARAQIGIAQIAEQPWIYRVGNPGLLHLLRGSGKVTQLCRHTAQPITCSAVLGTAQKPLINGHCRIELADLAQRIRTQQARIAGGAPLLVQRIEVSDGGVPQRLALHLAHQRQIGFLGVDDGVFFQRHFRSSLGRWRQCWLALPHQ